MLKRFLSVLVLGCGALVFSAAPAPASGGSVSAGFTHSCAVKANGDPVCWGDSEDGQIVVPPLTGTVTEIAAGGYHSCAIKTGGAPVCWGDNGTQQLDLPPGIEVTDISVGFTHTCAIETDGSPVCWGRNVDSQSTVPPGTPTVTQIVAGGNHTCLITPDGTPVCWGYDAFGQATVPPGLGPVTRISAALYHSCAIKTDGTPICWGKNEFGESTIPAAAGTVAEISTMGFHTCAIRTDGTPICWGKDDFGQSTIPPGIGTVTEISAGLNHTCLVKTGGTKVCWGDDDKGQIGAAPAITSAPPPAAGANRPYSHTVTATGSPAPRFSLTAGALPPGLSLHPTSGRITGTARASGTYAGAITASNGVFADATQGFSIRIAGVKAPAPSVDTTAPVIVIPAKNRRLTVRSPGVVLFRFGTAVEDTTGVISLRSTGKLGRARFSAAKDQSVVVRIKLSKKARKALRKRKKLKVKASIAVQDTAGNATMSVFRFTLRAAKAK